jgi:hypothetical protein
MKYSAYTYTIASEIILHFPFSENATDITIKKGNFKLPKLQKTKIYRAGSQALYGNSDGFHYLTWPGFVDFKINASELHYQNNAKCPPGLFSIFLSSEALGICLFLRDCFLLHGSAVLINEHASVFIGTPGAGKSTTVAAYAKDGFTVLSDDMVAVQFDKNNTAYVLAAGPEIKIWRDSAENLGYDPTKLEPAWEGKDKFLLYQNQFPTNEKFKLNALNVLLKPNSKKYKEEIRWIESPVLLLKYFPLPHQLLKSEEIKSHFEKSLFIFNQANFKYIRRPKTFQKLKEWVHAQK